MCTVRNWFYYPSMRGVWKIIHHFHRPVPCSFHFHCFGTKQVPERGSCEMSIVNTIHFKLCLRVAKLKLLFKIIILVYIVSLLYSQVMLHSIYLILKIIPKVFAMINPWEGMSTEHHIRKFSLLRNKCQAFSLALDRIRVCAKS